MSVVVDTSPRIETTGLTWRQQPVPLKVCAGDLTIWAPMLDLMVATTPFADLPAKVDLDDLPPLVPGAHGYLIRSCPTDGAGWRMRRAKGRFFYAPRRYDRHWVALEGSFESYLARLSGKTRTTLKRKVRKFEAAAGGRDFRVCRTPAEMTAFHALARQVSERSYQERLMNAGLPATPAFLDEMTGLAARGQVRGYLLFCQGEPVAYTYGPIEGDVVMYGHTGFDPARRALSPGTVLQFLILESLFAEGGFTRFDFTEGEGAHKALFGTHNLACADLYILCRRPGAFAPAVIQTVIERSTEMLADGLDRIGAKHRLRNLLRRA